MYVSICMLVARPFPVPTSRFGHVNCTLGQRAAAPPVSRSFEGDVEGDVGPISRSTNRWVGVSVADEHTRIRIQVHQIKSDQIRSDPESCLLLTGQAD